MEQMQLDGHLSTSLERTVPVLRIPDRAIQRACNRLEGMIEEEDSDDLSLDLLFFTIEYALEKEKCSEMTQTIASREQFFANVEHHGKEELSALVRDAARRTAWRDLLLNGTRPTFDNRVCLHAVCPDVFLKTLKKPISESSWASLSDTDLLMDGPHKCTFRSMCF
jgi:hypothetical protein